MIKFCNYSLKLNVRSLLVDHFHFLLLRWLSVCGNFLLDGRWLLRHCTLCCCCCRLWRCRCCCGSCCWLCCCCRRLSCCCCSWFWRCSCWLWSSCCRRSLSSWLSCGGGGGCCCWRHFRLWLGSRCRWWSANRCL
ncbi:CG14246 [Drosophila busckii]|uniref:CG14246 n=1 Tax=Drosophila busckii TaxID=30019 RepID=A0A0M4ENP3_DROBS|nr:CG14246 [Drosophila busckii]